MDEKKEWMIKYPKPWNTEVTADYNQKFPIRMEAWLDSGMGECVLRNPSLAKKVGDAIEFFDGERYTLATYIVMPNHVHVLFKLNGEYKMEQVVHSWKRFSSRQINEVLGRSGSLWQSEYWDTLIRSEKHFFRVVSYIKNNPNKAGLILGQYHLKEYERRSNEAFG